MLKLNNIPASFPFCCSTHCSLQSPLSAPSSPPSSDISGTIINSCTQFWKSLFIKHWGWKVSGYHIPQPAAFNPSTFGKSRGASLVHSPPRHRQDCCWVITMWPYPPPASVWTWITDTPHTWTHAASDLFFFFFLSIWGISQKKLFLLSRRKRCSAITTINTYYNQW